MTFYLAFAVVFLALLGLWVLANFALDHIARGIREWQSAGLFGEDSNPDGERGA